MPDEPEVKAVQNILTIEVAKRLRERGLLLPYAEGRLYETDQLREIARRQQQAMQLMDDLDAELQSL